MGKYAKAFVASAIAGLTALYTGLDDNVISTGEWVTVLIAALGALGVTYAVPNAPATPAAKRRPSQP